MRTFALAFGGTLAGLLVLGLAALAYRHAQEFEFVKAVTIDVICASPPLQQKYRITCQ
jgi:hypothetical protein